MIVVMPRNACAQDADLDFLKTLGAEFVDILESSENIVLDGAISYSTENDYYPVTLPQIFVNLEGAELDFGTIVANLTADANGQAMNGSFALPSELNLEIDGITYPIEVSSQSNSISWDVDNPIRNDIYVQLTGISQNNGGVNDPFIQVGEVVGRWRYIGAGRETVLTTVDTFDMQITPPDQPPGDPKSYFINGDSYIAQFEFVPHSDEWIIDNILAENGGNGINVNALKPAYQRLSSSMTLENVTVSEVGNDELFTIERIHSTKFYNIDDDELMTGSSLMEIDVASSNMLTQSMFPKRLKFNMDYTDIALQNIPTFFNLSAIQNGEVTPDDFDIGAVFESVSGGDPGIEISDSFIELNNGVVIEVTGLFGNASGDEDESRIGLRIEGWEYLVKNFEESINPQTASQLAQGNQLPIIIALTLAENYGKKSTSNGQTVMTFELGYEHNTGQWSINGNDF